MWYLPGGSDKADRHGSCPDLYLNSIRVNDGKYDLTHNLENIVYNELLFRDDSLSVFDNNGREIDFLAEKGNKKYYVQAACSIIEKDICFQKSLSDRHKNHYYKR